MKRAIFFILFGFTFILVDGQEYHPMLGDNTTWYTLWCGHHGDCFTTSIICKGDTVLRGQHYKFVYGYFDSRMYDVSLPGFIREDTRGQKIYWVRNFNSSFQMSSDAAANSMAVPDSNEVVLYDFSLAKGDSVYLYPIENCPFTHYSGWYYVDSIGVTNILVGKRKDIHLKHLDWKDDNFNMDWLEQIGDIEKSRNANITCAFKDGIHEYQDTTFSHGRGIIPSCYIKIDAPTRIHIDH